MDLLAVFVHFFLFRPFAIWAWGGERWGGGSGDNACMYGEERARSTWALTNGPIGLYIIDVQLSLIGPSCLGSLRISWSSYITIVLG